MIARCHYTTNPYFPAYGGRGIYVCEYWRSSFANFIADMGSRPSDKHSLDRIDNSLGYSPANCRWATAAEQAANRRNTLVITIDGVSKTTPEWARAVGANSSAIASRIRRGWPPERAISTPVRAKGSAK